MWPAKDNPAHPALNKPRNVYQKPLELNLTLPHSGRLRHNQLTHYRMNCFLWRSLLAYTWIKLTMSPVLSGFQPPNSTQVLLQPSSTRLWLKPHPLINELAIVTALSRQPLAQTGINASPSEMGTMQGKRTVFSTRLCIEDSSGPLRANQGIFKAEPRDSHAVCTLWVHPHPPPPIPPFLLSRTYLQRSLHEVMSRDESFMLDISGYFRERVKRVRMNISQSVNFQIYKECSPKGYHALCAILNSRLISRFISSIAQHCKLG